MENRVLYQPSTRWITIHVSDYHTWQGHISNVPDRFLGYIFETQNGRDRLPTKETIATEKVT